MGQEHSRPLVGRTTLMAQVGPVSAVGGEAVGYQSPAAASGWTSDLSIASSSAFMT